MVGIKSKGASEVPGGRDLNEEVNTLRSDFRLLSQRVDNVDRSVQDLRADVNTKHKENRASIHELRNNDQTMMELLHEIKVDLSGFKGRVLGYCAGAGAISGIAIAVVFKLLDLWKR